MRPLSWHSGDAEAPEKRHSCLAKKVENETFATVQCDDIQQHTWFRPLLLSVVSDFTDSSVSSHAGVANPLLLRWRIKHLLSYQISRVIKSFLWFLWNLQIHESMLLKPTFMDHFSFSPLCWFLCMSVFTVKCPVIFWGQLYYSNVPWQPHQTNIWTLQKWPFS